LKNKSCRIERGRWLKFTLSPLLQPYQGKLFCNHPDKGKKFKRSRYQELKWQRSSKCKCDDGDRYAELETHIPGSFRFYFQFSDDGGKKTKKVSGYFVVDPTLSLPDEDHLPLDCIALQTYLAKCLGPLSEWEARLRVAYEAGYNMIHLTPVQELGGSNSAYSLHDQLKLSSSFDESDKKYEFDDLKKMMEKLHRQWKMFFICDIVLNHTANCTPWLKDHPESAYNLANSPHLRPAYVIDDALWKFSSDIARGAYDSEGIPVYINHEEQLGVLHRILSEQILPALNLWEFYGVDVNKVVDDFKAALVQKINSLKNSQSPVSDASVSPEVMIVQDPEYRRLGSTIDIKKAVHWYISTRDTSLNETEWINHCCSSLRVILESLNNKIIHEDIPGHIRTITHNIVSTVRYERIDDKGPHLGYLSKEHPLVNRYFIDLSKDEEDVTEFKESIMYTTHSKFIVAHPGWIMGGSALDDFAAPESFAYLRREVIIWGDSVKLRYGQRPEDAPFLWSHMLEYVKLTASIFHGIRLDNCHSTPIHVAEYFIDEARQVRPDLYVIAELFTESEYTDNVFVNRLGLTSLIREAMSAHDSHEQGRLVYRYGGEPVGAFFHLSGKPMVNGIAHALYMDVTHDNPNPTEVRSVFDSFPTAALVNMACCATGSTRGNDELVPHHVNVVTDNRKYLSWKENNKTAPTNSSVSYLPLDSGMVFARRSLNQLHRMLAKDGYSQVYVDQMSCDIVAVTRHCPEDHATIVLVAHTAFSKPPDHVVPTTENKHIQTFGIKPLHVEGNIDEIILEGRTLVKVDTEEYIKSSDFINGLESHVVEIHEHLTVEQSQFVRVEHKEGSREVYFDSFPPGSVIAFKISLFPHVKEAVDSVRNVISNCCGSEASEWDSVFETLNLADMNRILYRCDAEERADGFGGGVYDIPNYGPFMYCGIQGFMSTMSSIRTNNDLGHPLCQNLREGNWLMDYTAQRLMRFEATKKFAKWLQSVIDHISKLPRYMVPGYFDVFITVVYRRLIEHVLAQMNSFIQNGSVFIKSLAKGSVQLVGSTSSAPLPALSPKLTSLNQKTSSEDSLLTISAGLPHFSVGLWRSWGRDTFISLRGLLLVTGRFQEARDLILAYGGCVRHGLIPNLLNGGTGARYNCRDATWWWLQAIQDYSRMAPSGHEILKCPVTRMYPDDESPPLSPGEVEQPLHDVIQEIMKRHFCGIEFRERNAVPDLERNSQDEAFNVKIGVDRVTGFVFGGNKWNNGTWMDKNGDSHTAGNAGIPATPRDGSSVEIVGLSKSTVRWLADMAKKKIFPFDGVKDDNTGESWSYSEWEKKIQNAFEEKFWISEEPDLKIEGEETGLIHKRGIYKDCYKATYRFTDYQLRPNFPLAMAVAPEMFSPKNAWTALEMIRKRLLGPLGIGTLDPDDWAYDGVYDNSQDSDNYKNARGFNYHQGPEWLWILGPYLRARLHFSKVMGGSRQFAVACDEVKRILSKHHQHLINSPWHGLPELTNVNGSYCKDSCEVQAWSMSCLLDVFYDMEKMME
ncbi:Glycogen debranching enzyme, partial [Paramuricea clavata]